VFLGCAALGVLGAFVAYLANWSGPWVFSEIFGGIIFTPFIYLAVVLVRITIAAIRHVFGSKAVAPR